MSVLSLIVVTRYIKTTNIRIRIRKKDFTRDNWTKRTKLPREENLIVSGALSLFLKALLSRFVLGVWTL